MGTGAAAEVVETGELRDRRGHRLLPAAERARLIGAFRGSGLTMAGFARREGIKYGTFTAWMYKAGAVPTAGRKPAIEFAQVQLPGPATKSEGMLEVRLPDGTVLRGERAADLAALIRALRT